ncbi:MAG: dihydroorotase [Bacteroidota bacterium]
MKSHTVLLSQVTAIGFGKAPERFDLRFDLSKQIVLEVAEAGTLQASQNEKHIQGKNLYLSPAWADLNAFGGEPNDEHRETLTHLAAAARAGGFKYLALRPDTQHPITEATTVSWLKQRGQELGVRFLPTGGLTQNLKGEDLTEILDFHAAGVLLFSNGNRCLQSASLVLKALKYLQTCEGVLVQFPQDHNLTEQAQLHEGIISTQLGMPGFPAFAESLIVERDLKLLEYAGGRLHFAGISTEASIEAVRQAKEKGLSVSCDVAAHQVSLFDADLVDFDTHKKIKPPFRNEKDKAATTEGLLDGTIDYIASHHTPWHEEAKKLEFNLAEFGIINLQTAASLAWESWGETLGIQNFIKKLSENPRRLLGIEVPKLEVGADLDFTLFAPDQEWTFTPENNLSKSANSPFFGKTMQGKIIKEAFS